MLRTKTILSENDFRILAGTIDFNCVSFYCSIKNNISNTKNTFLELLETLKVKLKTKRVTTTSYYNIIKPLEQIYENDVFWEQKIIESNNILVIFLNENDMTSFLLEKELKSGVHLTSNYYLLPLFKSVTNQQLQQDSLRIKQVVFDEKRTTNRLEKIIPLAYENKIDTLYVSSENGVYGIYDDLNKTTMIDNEKNSENMSLINLAAITTYMHQGKVFLVDPINMPTSGVSIQAILKS